METSGGGSSDEGRRIFKADTWFSQFRNGSNPWMARYIYALMFLIANLLAWAVRDYGRGALTEMESKTELFFIDVTIFLVNFDDMYISFLHNICIVNIHS